MTSGADISEVDANCYLDRNKQVLDRVPEPLRFISDVGVDVSRRVALTQRLIKTQLLELEISDKCW